MLLLIPLSEIKAIFYNSNLKVSWYLFSDDKKFLCNAIQEYSNIVIFGVVFYFLSKPKTDNWTRNIATFLFILNALDLVHLGLMDMQFFIIAKLILATIFYYLWFKLKPIS